MDSIITHLPDTATELNRIRAEIYALAPYDTYREVALEIADLRAEADALGHFIPKHFGKTWPRNQGQPLRKAQRRAA